ncbi:hypothetical protein ACSBR2_036833 [Camellia fascicularis]
MLQKVIREKLQRVVLSETPWVTRCVVSVETLASQIVWLQNCVGLRDGLQLAFDLNLRGSIDVEIDVLTVQQLLNKPIPQHYQLNNLISNSRFLMDQLGVTEVRHIFREANGCADILVKEARQLIE